LEDTLLRSMDEDGRGYVGIAGDVEYKSLYPTSRFSLS